MWKKTCLNHRIHSTGGVERASNLYFSFVFWKSCMMERECVVLLSTEETADLSWGDGRNLELAEWDSSLSQDLSPSFLHLLLFLPKRVLAQLFHSENQIKAHRTPRGASYCWITHTCKAKTTMQKRDQVLALLMHELVGLYCIARGSAQKFGSELACVWIPEHYYVGRRGGVLPPRASRSSPIHVLLLLPTVLYCTVIRSTVQYIGDRSSTATYARDWPIQSMMTDRLVFLSSPPNSWTLISSIRPHPTSGE
jgi:hypothetical protein